MKLVTMAMFLLLILRAPYLQSASVRDAPLIASTTLTPPYVDQEKGRLKGFAIDIIREIERRLNLAPIDIQVQPWKRALRWAEDGTSDLVFMSGPDPVREQWGDYMSTPLIVEHYQLYRLKEKRVELSHDYRQAASYRIGTELGCLYGHGLLRNAIDRQFSSNTVSADTLSNLRMLLSGRVDVIAADALRMQWALTKIGVEDEVMVVNFDDHLEPVVLEWPTYIVFSKRREHERLKLQFESALTELKRDGSYQRIMNGYLQSQSQSQSQSADEL